MPDQDEELANSNPYEPPTIDPTASRKSLDALALFVLFIVLPIAVLIAFCGTCTATVLIGNGILPWANESLFAILFIIGVLIGGTTAYATGRGIVKAVKRGGQKPD